MNRSLGTRAAGAAALVTAVLAGVAGAFLLVVDDLADSSELARRSSDVLVQASLVEKLAVDAETGLRGYVITREERFLQPYEDARRAMPGALARLRQMVDDDARQRAEAGRIAEQATSYLADYATPLVASVAVAPARSRSIAVTAEGKRRFDALRAEFDAFVREERRLAAIRNARADGRRDLATVLAGITVALALALGVALLLFVDRSIVRPLRQLTAAATGLAAGRRSAQTRVSGAGEVGVLGRAFSAMATDLDAANREIAQRTRALERRTAELARSNHDLEQYASVASHDLVSPLRVVSGFAELLERGHAEQLDDAARSHLSEIRGGVRRMHALIDDLLEFSRAGQAELRRVPVDAGDVVDTALRDLGPAIAAAGARVEVGDLPRIDADPGQLERVFVNLIGNAVKFRGSAPPLVRVSATRLADGTTEFRVSDNGIGIEPRFADRVFDMFRRLHTEGEYPGTGIGLAICARIVERHGGRIAAHPGDGGTGTTFVFTIGPDDADDAEGGSGPDAVASGRSAV